MVVETGRLGVRIPPAGSSFILGGWVEEIFIVKHDEFLIKGKLFPKLEKMLIEDISSAFRIEEVKAKIESERGRIYIKTKDKKAIEVLKRIFGISKIAKAYEFENYEKMKKEIVKLLNRETIYKIEVRRADKSFPKTSIETAREIAEFLYDKKIKVGVKRYDKIIYVEIRNGRVLLIYDEINGPGGFPKKFEGKAILLFSGGFDSVLVLYLALKQGIQVIPLAAVPDESIKVKLEKILRKFEEKYYLKLNRIFVKMPAEIFKIEEKLRQIGFKRFLYLLAYKYAKKHKCKAILTGEVIGQTHTQRLANLQRIQRGIDLPFIRPLSFYSKNEIIKKVREIEFYDEAEKIPEFCSLSKKVKTNPSIEDMKKIEMTIEEMVKNSKEWTEETRKMKEEKEEEIINLNEKKGLYKVLNHDLSKNKKYILVCKSGSTAKMFAEELRRHGFDAIGISEDELK